MKTPRLLCLVAAVSLAGCATTANRNVVWYNPATWVSHREANAADQANAEATKARADAEARKVDAQHAAHSEFTKAGLMLAFAPPSREVTFSQRFLANGLGLLDQVDPMPAAEVLDLRKTVADLRSENKQVRAAAEKSQEFAEIALGEKSRSLTAAETRADQAEQTAKKKDALLREAFDRENSLANELRNEHFKFWAAVIGVILLSLVALYVRLQLSGVGEAVHSLSGVLPTDTMGKVISALDGNLSGFGQGIVRNGRAAAAVLEAKMKAVAQHFTPGTPPG